MKCGSPNRGTGKYHCEKDLYHDGICLAWSKWGGRVFWAKPEGWDEAARAREADNARP